VAYRLGKVTVHDPEAGELALEGDGYAAAGEAVTLLASPDVQRFLRMSDAEVDEGANVVARYRSAVEQRAQHDSWTPSQVDPPTRAAGERVWADLETLLGPERTASLKRLSWRVRDGDALLDDDVAAALHLTPAQREAIATMAAGNEADHQRVLADIRSVRLRDHRELEARGRQADQAGHERLLATLTPEQRAAFEALKKAPR
jgi:hypothetical protein